MNIQNALHALLGQHSQAPQQHPIIDHMPMRQPIAQLPMMAQMPKRLPMNPDGTGGGFAPTPPMHPLHQLLRMHGGSPQGFPGLQADDMQQPVANGLQLQHPVGQQQLQNTMRPAQAQPANINLQSRGNIRF